MTNHRLAAGAAALCVCQALAGRAMADDPVVLLQKDINENASSLYNVDIAVPTAAALAVIGQQDPSQIGSDIAPDLYFQASPVSKGVPDLALATRPYWTVFHPRQTIEAYQGASWPEHVLGRTLFSLAAANNSAGTGYGLGLGLSTVLTDVTDPRLDAAFTGCVQALGIGATQSAAQGGVTAEEKDAAKKMLIAAFPAAAAHPELIKNFTDATTGDQIGDAFDLAANALGTGPDQARQGRANALFAAWTATQPAADSSSLVSGYQVCVTRATNRYQTNQAAAVGVGLAYKSLDFTVKHLAYAGVSVWGTYRIPLFPRPPATDAAPTTAAALAGSLNLSARYISNDLATVGAKQLPASTEIGAATFALSRGAFQLSATAAYYGQQFEHGAAPDQRFGRFSGSLAVPLISGFQASLSGGTTTGRRAGADNFVTFTLSVTSDALKKITGAGALLAALPRS